MSAAFISSKETHKQNSQQFQIKQCTIVRGSVIQSSQQAAPFVFRDALNCGPFHAPKTWPVFGMSNAELVSKTSEAEAHLGAKQQQQQQPVCSRMCLAICFDFYHQIKSWNVFNQDKTEFSPGCFNFCFIFYKKLFFVLRMVLYYPHSQVSWIFHSLPFSLQANSPSDQCSNALMKNSWAASQEYIIYQISVSWPGRAERANRDYPHT